MYFDPAFQDSWGEAVPHHHPLAWTELIHPPPNAQAVTASTVAVCTVKVCFLRPAALAPEDLLAIEIFRPHSRPTESATPEAGPAILVLTSLAGDSGE